MATLSNCVAGMVLLLTVTAYCDGQAAQCTAAPASQNTQVYALSASSGTPIPQNPLNSYVFNNDTAMVVRLADINPFAFQCSLTSSSQAFKETAISSFLGDIGGVANVGASTPNPSPSAGAAPANPAAPRPFIANNVPQTPAPRSPCADQYLDQVHQLQVLPLKAQRDAINAALGNTLAAEKASLQTFAQDVEQLRNQISCSATVQSATTLAGRGAFAIATVNGVPLDQAIDQLSNQSQTLLAHLTDGMDASCKQSLAAMINEDSAFLAALVHGSTAVPAAVDQWRSQFGQLNSVNGQLASARSTVQAVLQNRQNFTIDTPVSGNQTDVKVTASCSPVAVLQVAVTTSTNGAPLPNPSPQAGAKPVSASTANPWSQDFKFGPGPRFVLSGGVVISPLPQITYSTSSNPTSGGPANIIIKQQQSNTRILPVAMLSGRFWDQLPYKERYRILPNYLSVGLTGKSTGNSGTNIEYLFGLSWAFADRQLFFTAGAYSGWQQRLNGGLTVGQGTSLSSSNLPTSQTTVWKPGFSITWAPAGK